MKLDNFHWLYISSPQWVRTWINRTSEMNNAWEDANKAAYFIEYKTDFEFKVITEFGMSIAQLHEVLNEYEMTISKESQWTQRFANQMKDKQKEINMTHEKKKMTRAEAVKLFAKYHIYGDANDTVDFYIEAGMLEIVEEKALVCDHVDSRPMIIKRHGKIIYDETS